MAQSLNSSQHKQHSSPLDTTPATAVTGGDIAVLNGGIIGAYDRDLAANEFGTLVRHGIRRLKKDGTTGPTFAVGETVVWDESAQLAVNLGLAANGVEDIPYGICVEAAGTNQDFVLVAPFDISNRYAVLQPFVVEFIHDDTTTYQLIPAWMNQHGLVIEQIYGIVTEAPAGSSEDQLIITVSDESDNALATLTTTDASPDAAGDIIIGTNGVWGASTGDALPKTVAAGEYVDAVVTQATAGTPAGQVKVYVVCRPLV